MYLSVTFIPTIILLVFVILTFTVALKAGALRRRAKHGRTGSQLRIDVMEECDAG
jgi:heme/copper-type cytochrome/quinol oxidase subunit 2